MGLQIQRSEPLELTLKVCGTATLITKPYNDERLIHLDDSVCLALACGAAIHPIQEEDKFEAHAAFLVEAKCFGVLDCGATTSFGSVDDAKALFSQIKDNDTRLPDDDPSGGRSFNLGDGASSKATPLSRLPVRNEALGDTWVLVHSFSALRPTKMNYVDVGHGLSQGTSMCGKLWRGFDTCSSAVSFGSSDNVRVCVCSRGLCGARHALDQWRKTQVQ